MQFKEQVVWITGASSGIGEALALEFARHRSRLVLSGRKENELERVARDCREAGADILILPLDLLDTERFDASIEKIIDRYGRIDVLINNAGISQRSLTADTSLLVDRSIFEVNFFGPIALTKKVLAVMLTQKSGYLVAVSSIVGKFGFPLRSAYSASKHALHGFFESLRAEYQNEGIKVSMIIPGRIRTKISLNALTGEGNVHAEMDPGQEDGMDVNQCAKKIVKGLRKEKKEILVGGKEIMMVHIRRIMPFLYYKMAGKISTK